MEWYLYLIIIFGSVVAFAKVCLCLGHLGPESSLSHDHVFAQVAAIQSSESTAQRAVQGCSEDVDGVLTAQHNDAHSVRAEMQRLQQLGVLPAHLATWLQVDVPAPSLIAGTGCQRHVTAEDRVQSENETHESDDEGGMGEGQSQGQGTSQDGCQIENEGRSQGRVEDDEQAEVGRRVVTLVHSLPVFQFTGEENDGSRCSVCIDEIYPLPACSGPCGHSVHVACLVAWLVRAGDERCPVCCSPLASLCPPTNMTEQVY